MVSFAGIALKKKNLKRLAQRFQVSIHIQAVSKHKYSLKKQNWTIIFEIQLMRETC